MDDIKKFKIAFAESIMKALLASEKEEYANELESFESHAEHTLAEARKFDEQFEAQLLRGARLVRAHFLQLRGEHGTPKE